ncbi:signal recognition particle subunit SRP19/SEC65 family protein [Desulfurococcus mucosus]|uniref:Signal recognition particle 19 kDa protein n=1 Tax=Desulfurococcus mucosus (strain ATCC 35584 / DSM 2162 / JCM 9187 / O7/1) TaxID=765177 RepID=E8R714_DESM0|nr:signal recognition particle subunit SRP19/SEC65 family protein [Desulfurococcus mucosus]ADV64447.1 signal recognition particle, subunit SRP19 (srp19) [Desulfurococcus mucosus DSM 2162]
MSREYKGRKIVVYPSYIDSKKSRREGRKIRLSDAVPNPGIDEILEACRRLGLNPVHEEKQYPRIHGLRGRVLVDKKMSKLSTLIAVAREIKRMRGDTRS